MPATEAAGAGGLPETDFISAENAYGCRRLFLTGLLILVVALILRVGFVAAQTGDNPEMWSRTAPFGQDEMGNISVNLAQGRGYSSPFSLGSTATAWLCPLIPMLWAFVIWCAGSATGHTTLIVMYISTIPSAACVVVYRLIARHLLRGSPAVRRTAFLVAAIFCVWPEAFYEIDYLWYFPYQELAAALMVLLGLKWIDRPSLKAVLPVGVTTGILALINVTPMPIFQVILALPVLQHRENWRRILGYGTVGASIAFLIMFPWLVRDAVVFHAMVPLRSNAGFQFWEGTNPDGCVREMASSHQPEIQRTELQRYRAMGEIAYSQQGYSDALAYIRQHPREALGRTAERAYVFWLTDAFDQWRWDQKSKPWWDEGHPAIVRNLSSILAAWGLAILMIWAFASKRLTALPYKWLFVSILFILPFIYYFTLAENEYSQILRSWMLLLVILAFSAGFPRKAASTEEISVEG